MFLSHSLQRKYLYAIQPDIAYLIAHNILYYYLFFNVIPPDLTQYEMQYKNFESNHHSSELNCYIKEPVNWSSAFKSRFLKSNQLVMVNVKSS